MAVQDASDVRSTDLDRSQENAHAARCPIHGTIVVKKRSRAKAHQKNHTCSVVTDPCGECGVEEGERGGCEDCVTCGSALGSSEADEDDFAHAHRVSGAVQQ